MGSMTVHLNTLKSDQWKKVRTEDVEDLTIILSGEDESEMVSISDFFDLKRLKSLNFQKGMIGDLIQKVK